jgi:Ankyrin repeats (3 copies)
MTASFTMEELIEVIKEGHLVRWAQGKKITRQDFLGSNTLVLTPLHWAADRGYLDQAADLLEKNGEHFTKDDFLKPDYDGRTPLHEAARAGHLDQAVVILEKNKERFTKEDFLKPDNDGSTPLREAAQTGHLDQIFIAEHFTGRVREMEELWRAVPEASRNQFDYNAIRQRTMELTIQRVRPVLRVEHGMAVPNPSSKSARRSKRRPTH